MLGKDWTIKSKLVSNLLFEEKMTFSEKLNEFYCRYERNDVKENLYETIEELVPNHNWSAPRMSALPHPLQHLLREDNG